MTYKSDEYNKLDRNHTRAKAMLGLINTARDFNLMKYADDICIVATTRDGTKIEIRASSSLKSDLIMAGVSHCTSAAKTISAEKTEDVDFDKAAAV